jgi:hypothetical protein
VWAATKELASGRHVLAIECAAADASADDASLAEDFSVSARTLCDWLHHESLSLLLVQPFSPTTTDTAAAALAAAIVLVESGHATSAGEASSPPRAPPHVVLRRSIGGGARDGDAADVIEAAGGSSTSAARALRDVKGFNAKAFIEASDAAAADAVARAEVAKEYVGALIAACVVLARTARCV